MTTYNEVHLFGWIKENATIIGAFMVVVWAMLVFWFKTIVNRYITHEEAIIVTKEQIQACKSVIDKKDDELEKGQIDIAIAIKELNQKIDHLDDRRRSDAVENSKEHQNIMAHIIRMIKQ